MASLSFLWQSSGEAGVLRFVVDRRNRLAIVQIDLQRARYRRAYEASRRVGRPGTLVESFQFSRLLTIDRLDTVIRIFEAEERSLIHDIQYATLTIFLTRRTRLRGIRDWGQFDD